MSLTEIDEDTHASIWHTHYTMKPILSKNIKSGAIFPGGNILMKKGIIHFQANHSYSPTLPPNLVGITGRN